MIDLPKTFFETEQPFVDYIGGIDPRRISPEEKLEHIKHERSHAEAARRLGYKVQYGIEELDLPWGVYIFRAFIKTDPEITDPAHLEEVLRAPEYLSSTDKKRLESLT